MNCPNCGKEIVAGAKFCANCGATAGGAPQAGAAGAQPKTSGMAIASLVLGILGFLSSGLTGIAGIITGAIALGRIKNSQGQQTGRGLAIAGIVTGAVSMVLIFFAIIAAIAIPGFISAKGKAYQAEAKTGLMNIYTAQMSAYAETGQYAATFAELPFSPMENSHYAYFLSADEAIQPAGKNYSLPPEVQAFVEGENFQIVAVGNIDSDDDLDLWAIDQNQTLTNIADDLR